MATKKQITQVVDVVYHRNGVAGTGFHVVLFEHNGRPMLATVFPSSGHLSVLDASLVGEGNIRENTWRGDLFEEELRAAIKGWRSNEHHS